jgi:hypothetical protein
MDREKDHESLGMRELVAAKEEDNPPGFDLR